MARTIINFILNKTNHVPFLTESGYMHWICGKKLRKKILLNNSVYLYVFQYYSTEHSVDNSTRTQKLVKKLWKNNLLIRIMVNNVYRWFVKFPFDLYTRRYPKTNVIQSYYHWFLTWCYIHVYFDKSSINICSYVLFKMDLGGSRGCDRMVIRFTTTCAISAYHH